jgi:hypothetical protein
MYVRTSVCVYMHVQTPCPQYGPLRYSPKIHHGCILKWRLTHVLCSFPFLSMENTFHSILTLPCGTQLASEKEHYVLLGQSNDKASILHHVTEVIDHIFLEFNASSHNRLKTSTSAPSSGQRGQWHTVSTPAGVKSYYSCLWQMVAWSPFPKKTQTSN